MMLSPATVLITAGARGLVSIATLMLRVPAVLVLPAASICVALRVSLPCPIAVMSSPVSV